LKAGDPIKKLLHESGEDIFISYRTGKKVLIKAGKIAEVLEGTEGYNKIQWTRADWAKQEQLAAIEQEQAQLAAFHLKATKDFLKKQDQQKKQERAAKAQ
jgi:hypothetical protein